MVADLKAAFAGAVCHRLIDTWWAWRAAQPDGMPRRSSLEPDDLAPVMGNTTVIDAPPGPEEVVIRLAGIHVVARWGFELSGWRYVDCMGSTNPREQARQVVEAAHQPCGMRTLRRVYRAGSPEASRVELCFLPVHDDRCGVPQFFVVGAAESLPNTPRPGPIVRCADEAVAFLDLGWGVPRAEACAYA